MECAYWECEADVIDPRTQMHYAQLCGYNRARFPQSHDFFELFLALDGVQSLEIDGARTRVDADTLVMIRPGEMHTRRYLSPGRHINVAFSAEVARQLFAYLGDGFPTEELLGRPAPLRAALTRAETQAYRARFDALNMIPLDQAARSRTLLRVLLLEIFTRDLAPPGDEAAQDDWFARTLREMNRPEALEMGVEAMVAFSGKTHEHLCRVFRERMGTTPTAYVNDLRLNYAANRLRHSSDAIAEICYQAGFQNLSHFYHLFREKFRAAPGAFRMRAGRVRAQTQADTSHHEEAVRPCR